MTFIEKINARIVDELTGGLGVTDIAKQLDSLLPEDREYALKHLPNHMAKAGRGEQLYRWLTDFHFIEAKVSALGAQPLIEDYTLGSNPDFRLSGKRERTLTLIQGAIRLSAHILEQDKTQLAGQLLGRLQGTPQSALAGEEKQGNPDIQAMRSRAKQWKGAPGLRPMTPNLTPPGGALPSTLTGHTDWVNAVAITPDGQKAVSASRDSTLKIWDLNSGEEMATFTGDGWFGGENLRRESTK